MIVFIYVCKDAHTAVMYFITAGVAPRKDQIGLVVMLGKQNQAHIKSFHKTSQFKAARSVAAITPLIYSAKKS